MSGGHVLEIRSIGGQAKSDLWCQIKADATGCQVVVPEFTDAPTLGAAAIAGVGAGVFSSFPEGAKQMTRVRKIIEPNRERHGRYQNLFEIYQDVYMQLRPLFGRLADV
jgi:xylulokinase